MSTLDLAWMERAACRDTDPGIFFAGLNVGAAKKICAGCPVATDCLAFQLTVNPRSDFQHGVSGRTTAVQRKHLLQHQRKGCTR